MLSGILLLDKPCGLSSNGALQRVRSLYARVKAGHVGSLDPLATGMLPICLGEATKVAGEIISARKRYRFTLVLGRATTTGDAEGEVCAEAAVPSLQPSIVEAILARFRGRQQQVPPMYSALKRDGQPLYRLARAGVTVERSAREIELNELILTHLSDAALEFEALCSKGTYIRVLAQDIAQALGTLGHVSVLRRLYVEPFEAYPMHTLGALQEAAAQGQGTALIPCDRALVSLPAVHLTGVEAQRVLHGQRIACAQRATCGRVRLYDERERFIGIGDTDGNGAVQPRRLLNPDPGDRSLRSAMHGE